MAEPTPLWADHTDVLGLWVAPPAAPSGVDEQIDSLCRVAELKIKREFPKIQDRIDDDPELAELAGFVVVQMVQSLYRNPRGLQYFQEQSGPFLKSGNYAASALALMRLTDEQRDLLKPQTSGRASSTSLDPNNTATGLPAVNTDYWP